MRNTSSSGQQPPTLGLAQDEARIRREAKEKIAARYGFTDWSDAPDGALRDYVDFLRTRTETRP